MHTGMHTGTDGRGETGTNPRVWGKDRGGYLQWTGDKCSRPVFVSLVCDEGGEGRVMEGGGGEGGRRLEGAASGGEQNKEQRTKGGVKRSDIRVRCEVVRLGG